MGSHNFFRDNCYVINDILRFTQTTFLFPLYILPQIIEKNNNPGGKGKERTHKIVPGVIIVPLRG